MLVSVLPIVLIGSLPLHAARLAHRVFDQDTGLTGSWVQAMGQDSDGYLWLATVGGVVRFDGVRFRTWSDRPNIHHYIEVATGPQREVLVIDTAGNLVQVDGERLANVAGPDGRPLDGVRSAAFGEDGTLWLALESAMLVRRGGAWTGVELPTGAGKLRRVTTAADGGAYVTAGRGILRIASDLTITTLLDRDGLTNILELEDGALAVMDNGLGRTPAVRRFHHGRLEEMFAIEAQPRDLTRRGSTLVASFDRFLAILVPGRPPAVVGPDDGLPSGGSLLVDAEGSLWVGTIQGLIQYPEPETSWFGEAEGVPSSHARYLNGTEEGIWVTTWQGLALLVETPKGWDVSPYPGRGIPLGCVDAQGGAWGHQVDWLALTFTLLERRHGRDIVHRIPGFKWIETCARAPDGGLWMAGNLGLLRSAPGDGAPRLVPGTPTAPDGDPYLRDVFEDSRGRLWVSFNQTICHAPADQVAQGLETAWACQSLEGFRHTAGFAEVSDGSIWVAAHGGGILRHLHGSWEPVPASQGFPTMELVLRSLPGGVWVLGYDVAMRVEDRPDLPEGWVVLERLSTWNGLPPGGRTDVLEQEDGTLWVTTNMGAVRVPAQARSVPRAPPRVHLTEVLLDGRQLPHDPRLVLPYDDNRLELHFSALSFRDPGLLRYQIRTGSEPGDLEPLDKPSVRLAELAPGDHSVEVTASLDGASWSPHPARLAFRVAYPWYLQAWFVALVAALVAAAVYATHRARLASLMRLERQRARIAMDLHDEMGSGLGSIGILAGLAAGDRLGEDRRRAVSSQIAETAGELGTALDEIVWSLRPGTDSIEALAAELAERGRRLFPDGQAMFQTVFPDRWPLVRLEPAVRRNLQRIAVEALHNAARHAQARSVTLVLEPSGRRWRLRVQDDGSGMPPGAEQSGGGLGLRGIRERARQIGAVVKWLSPPEGGTVLTLDFDPQSGARGASA